ncbi:hypothetical protein HQ576_19970 [bacterium]|nr:hypothetical protein [bacterium]
MSAIDLLLGFAVDYELTHQIVLYTLFEKSDLPFLLAGVRRTQPTEWEPERQLFDLGLSSDAPRVLLEIKMWSDLTSQQLDRQVEHLKTHGYRGGYILLGTSWFEFDEAMLAERTSGRGERFGYEQIIDGLDRLLDPPGLPPDVRELALAYRNALDSQFRKLKDACHSDSKDRCFYYSLFWLMKQKLKELKTAIYTVNNPGGPVYILNNQLWEWVDLDGIMTELYYEVVNDRLCIKFHADSKDGPTRRRIRDAVRCAAHAVLDKQLRLIDTGRLGAYMTACQVEHDFSILKHIDKSVEVFAGVGRSLALIADRLRSAE